MMMMLMIPICVSACGLSPWLRACCICKFNQVRAHTLRALPAHSGARTHPQLQRNKQQADDEWRTDTAAIMEIPFVCFLCLSQCSIDGFSKFRWSKNFLSIKNVWNQNLTNMELFIKKYNLLPIYWLLVFGTVTGIWILFEKLVI